MAQVQTTEKRHAACDECRTRKLKCSGDTPNCVRCRREGIECVYSPQKQMGRPRKRRREGASDELAEPSPVAPVEQTNILNDVSMIPDFPDFGLISPPELQDHISSNGSTGNGPLTPSQYDIGLGTEFGLSPVSNFDFGMDPTIDPSLWNLQSTVCEPTVVENPPQLQTNIGPCSCLSLVYLTLTELQSIQTFSFPQVVIPLRKARSALFELIHCPKCPKEAFSAVQNIQSIVALFKAIVDRFNKVLIEVDAEAARLERTGQKKPYRVGDNSPALFHLHTGTSDCPLGFNIELEAKDWKKLVKTALKTEVYGGGHSPRSLTDLITETEDRQKGWHNDKEFWIQEYRHLFPHGRHDCTEAQSCEALGADHIRRAIDNLSWD